MGESVFLTEKQIEAWLEFETRRLPMPDGSHRPFTYFRYVWEKLDDLDLLAGYSPDRLVEFAIEENQISGVQIEKTLNGCISYLYDHLDALIAKKKILDGLKEKAQYLTGKATKAFQQANDKSSL